MIEHFFQCPHCWQTISVILDSSVPNQEYIEDCEVCCNPIHFRVAFKDSILASFEIKSIDQ